MSRRTLELPAGMKSFLDALDMNQWRSVEDVLAETSANAAVTFQDVNAVADACLIESKDEDGQMMVRMTGFGLVMRDVVHSFPERPGGPYQE